MGFIRIVPLAAAAVLGLAACSGGDGTFVAPVAAVVGGTRITERNVVTELKVSTAGTDQAAFFQAPSANLTRLDSKRQILSQLIGLQAAANKARSLGVAVDDAKVAAAIVGIAQGLGGAKAFDDALASHNLTLEEYEEYQRFHLTLDAVDAKVTSNVKATADQIAAAYQADKATYDGEYQVAHILICSHHDLAGVCTPTAADLALARTVAGRAGAGADFAALARQYSADPATASTGGDLGWFRPQGAPPAFEQAALGLQPGQVAAEPVQTVLGYHVIKLIAKGRPLAAASSEINDTLERAARQQAFVAWLHQAVASSRIQVNPAFGIYDPASQSVLAPPGAEPLPPSFGGGAGGGSDNGSGGSGGSGGGSGGSGGGTTGP